MVDVCELLWNQKFADFIKLLFNVEIAHIVNRLNLGGQRINTLSYFSH